MKQLLQNLGNGSSQIIDVPCPSIDKGQLLIQTSVSLISSGTERMLAQFGKANFIEKARQQPDKVKMVINKIKTDGVLSTLAAVKSKLDQSLPMGYSNVGRVLEVGPGVEGWSVGDRVLSNGPHAEIIRAPKNLCAKIPDDVSDEHAAFTVLSAIGLQGVRLAMPTLGETFVVIGLGLIGLLTVQLLKAHGCRVIGIDFDESRLALAKQFGAATINLTSGNDPVVFANTFTREQGVDGVIITAATKSNEPMHQAAQMCRKRGRIILVGVTGLELSRADFYEKELSFQVSCSYGPGRYDVDYEERGNDYPIGYVRWTEQRNFEAVLGLLANKLLNVEPLISHHFLFENAFDAYNLLTSNESSLGILLKYPSISNETLRQNSIKLRESVNSISSAPVIGFIGAGNYASRVLIPAFKKTSAVLKTIVTQGSISGVHVGNKFDLEYASTDISHIMNDDSINTVVIASRHDSHATLICQALSAKKNVFVEKPLCLTLDELNKITQCIDESPNQLVMVGFNRRFAPLVREMKKLLEAVTAPKVFVMTVNAGAIPSHHWTQDKLVGGGRILGEACHFIDLLRFLSHSEITNFTAVGMENKKDENATITLNFEDGSLGAIHYICNGHNSYPKERLDVFCSGSALQLNNYRTLYGFGWPKFKKIRSLFQDKGQQDCAREFVKSISEGKQSPISINEILEVSKIAIQVAEYLRA